MTSNIREQRQSSLFLTLLLLIRPTVIKTTSNALPDDIETSGKLEPLKVISVGGPCVGQASLLITVYSQRVFHLRTYRVFRVSMEGQAEDGVFIKSEENEANKIDFEKICNSKRITIIGDPEVGKTCILMTYTTKKFPTEYIPTVFDNCPGKLVLDKIKHHVCLWDTSGQEDYERLRTLSYPETDCFLLCFSVNDRTSYENIFSKWYPELYRYCPEAIILLIGTKTDLRKCITNCITLQEGINMKKKIGAANYFECSALENEGLSLIFVEAIREIVKNSDRSHCTFCNIL